MTEQHKQTAIVRARQVWNARQALMSTIVQTPTVVVPALVGMICAHDSELDRLCMIEGVVDALLDDMTKELLTLSGASTTSPADSPDSQAIEQVRDRLKATSGLSGEQALVVLEDLRRILGVTQ